MRVRILIAPLPGRNSTTISGTAEHGGYVGLCKSVIL